MKDDKKQRVALVTGSGKRLGKHIAIALAEHGFDVAVHYHSSREGALKTVSAVKKSGKDAKAFRADVSRKKSVESLIKSVGDYFGRIDVVVNNSGIFMDAPFEGVTEQLWDSMLNTNLKGPFLVAQSALPYLKKSKSGRIINIASLGGIQAWGKRHLPYSVSKAGVIMLTRCLAKSLAPNIHVNAIAPGTIEMDEAATTDSQVSVNSIPLQRFGKASDITNMVVYLATTSQYITGQVFVIDGGRSA